MASDTNEIVLLAGSNFPNGLWLCLCLTCAYIAIAVPTGTWLVTSHPHPLTPSNNPLLHHIALLWLIGGERVTKCCYWRNFDPLRPSFRTWSTKNKRKIWIFYAGSGILEWYRRNLFPNTMLIFPTLRAKFVILSAKSWILLVNQKYFPLPWSRDSKPNIFQYTSIARGKPKTTHISYLEIRQFC